MAFGRVDGRLRVSQTFSLGGRKKSERVFKKLASGVFGGSQAPEKPFSSLPTAAKLCREGRKDREGKALTLPFLNSL